MSQDPSLRINLSYELTPGIRWYLIGWGICWTLGLTLWIALGYHDSFLVLNRQHVPWLDVLMPHLTHLGDGYLIGGLLAIWAVRKDKALLVCLLLTMLLLVLLINNVGKSWLFDGWWRPPLIFGQKGIDIHYITLAGERFKSFPSGHSASAGAIGFWYVWTLRKKPLWVALGISFLALLAAYSRVYIGVHFLGDIVVGSMVGVAVAYGLWRWAYPWLEHRLAQVSQQYDSWIQTLVFLIWLLILYLLIEQHYL
ncbi:MAG: phosphatase PAP2 family protein [Bacteroidota bacterium]